MLLSRCAACGKKKINFYKKTKKTLIFINLKGIKSFKIFY